MKRAKIQILIMVILLGKGISLYCMFASLRRAATVRRPVTSGMSPRATAARLAIVGQQKTLSSQRRVVESKPDTSTWSGWAQSKLNQFKSLFQRSQPQQQVRSVVPSIGSRTSGTSPFGRGGQRRSYSTSTLAKLQEPIAVSISPDNKAVDQREAEEILQKLKGKNPWNLSEAGRWNYLETVLSSPLGKQIGTFLNENETNVIEPVVTQLIGQKNQHPIGQEILEKIVEKNDGLATRLFPIVEKSADKVQPDLLGTILMQLSSEQLLQAKNMIENFFAGINAYDLILGYKYTYKDISRMFPQDVSQFLHVIQIMCSKPTIIDIAKSYKEEYDRFTSNLANTIREKLGDDDFKDLIQVFSGPNISIPIIVDIFKKLIVTKPKYIKQLLQTEQGRRIGLWIVKYDLKSRDFLIDYLKMNLLSMEKSVIKELLEGSFGQELLVWLVLHNAEFKTFLGNYIKREKDLNIEFMPVELLSKILNSQDFLETVFNIDNRYAQTPSYRHLVKYYSALYRVFPFVDSTFRNMVQNILHKEKELQDNGYEVFYHGRRWEYGFLSDIYGMLYEFKSGKKLNDFIFTHLDDPVIGKVSEKFFESERKKRERLASEGNPNFTKELFESKSKEDILKVGEGYANIASILFLNKFLFGNLNNLGSNSIYYVLENWNVGKIAFSIKEIFSMFGYSDIYKAHEQELLALQKKYEALSQYGELLQIAVPKKDLDKCIYYTTSGGPKLSFKTSSGTTTTDIKAIVEDLDKNPQDRVEFVGIETSDAYGLRNPDSGIKIFSYNLVEPEKMAEFKEEEKSEFGKIEKDLRERNMQQEVENQ